MVSRKSQPAPTHKALDIDDFLEPMFENREKTKPARPVEEKKNVEKSFEQSTSQMIENDLSQNDILDNESLAIESCPSPAPQIETNDFDEDVSFICSIFTNI